MTKYELIHTSIAKVMVHTSQNPENQGKFFFRKNPTWGLHNSVQTNPNDLNLSPNDRA